MAEATQQNDELVGQTAVVIGGSMAGLLAARVLAERFAEVIVLERDVYPAEVQPRKGVPQGQHAHALLPSGQIVLAELFPGLREHLLEQGALRGFGRYFSGGGFLCRVQVGWGGLYASRPLLEAEVRARVMALPNVRVRAHCNVMGLLAEPAPGGEQRVVGVRVQDRGQQEDGVANVPEELAADLVVDASGRGSRMDDWLELLGYAAPEVEIVEVGMGYASRLYRREAHDFDGDLVLNIAATRANKRACGMLAQEGDRWIVTLAGYFGDHPPTDDAGFLMFAKQLPTQEVYELIRHAQPLSDPVAFKFPSNQRRHYERLARLPAGLVVIGDAVCSFTPIYGQGMSVAAMEAMELRAVLEAGLDNVGKRFFQRIEKVVDMPWSITVGNDRRLAADYAPSLGRRCLNWYMDKLLVAARTDVEVAKAFMQVAALLKAPPSVLHPKVAWRVARTWLRRAPAPTPASSLATSDSLSAR